MADVVAIGEGEITALEISQALRDLGPHADLSDVAGLVWQRGGQFVHNQPRPYTPMDEWPLLDYGLVDVESLFHLFPGREDGRRVDALSLDAPGGQSLRMDRPAAGQAACLCLHAQSQVDPLGTGAQQLRK